MSGELFLGLDLGTSGLKAVALGAGGDLAARARADYPTARPEPSAAEQSPGDWWTALETAVATLRAGGAPVERWAGMGLSGMLPTLVLADEAGEPVAPAITLGGRPRRARGRGAARPPGRRAPLCTHRPVGRRTLPSAHAPASRPAGAARHRTRRPPPRRQGLALPAPYRRGRHRPEHEQEAVSGCYGSRRERRLERGRGGRGRRAGLAAPPAAPVASRRLPTLPGRSAVYGVASAGRRGCGAPGSAGRSARLSWRRRFRARLPGTRRGAAGRRRLHRRHEHHVARRRRPLRGRPRAPLPDHAGLPSHDGWGYEMDLLTTGSAFRWLAGLLGAAGGDEAALMALAAGVEPGAAGLTFLPYLAPGEQGAPVGPRALGRPAGAEPRPRRRRGGPRPGRRRRPGDAPLPRRLRRGRACLAGRCVSPVAAGSMRPSAASSPTPAGARSATPPTARRPARRSARRRWRPRPRAAAAPPPVQVAAAPPPLRVAVTWAPPPGLALERSEADRV